MCLPCQHHQADGSVFHAGSHICIQAVAHKGHFRGGKAGLVQHHLHGFGKGLSQVLGLLAGGKADGGTKAAAVRDKARLGGAVDIQMGG